MKKTSVEDDGPIHNRLDLLPAVPRVEVFIREKDVVVVDFC